MAKIVCCPNPVTVELSTQEACALMALSAIDTDAMLRTIRASMGNVIFPPEYDVALKAFLSSCRMSQALLDATGWLHA